MSLGCVTMADKVELTEEQQRALNFARTGHNLCIFGKAGVGKSVLVKAIKEDLTSRGLRCQIICPSGVSCDCYGNAAKTVHSQYGLQTAELPANILIDRSLKRNNIVDQISSTDVLIWDEISMSSCRVFNIVNAVHHIISNNNFAFGGIQVVIVGDFWQLKPVPNPLDPGHSILVSQLFDNIFPHRIELQRVLRQGDEEQRLKDALDVLRNGECSDEVEEYFKSLERELESNDGIMELPLHIYFKRLPAEVHNMNMLVDLPGQLFSFPSHDVGNAVCLEGSVGKILTLKPGCKIMLTYNINNHLRNGYQGHFVGVNENDGDELIVSMPSMGNVAITRRTWYKRTSDGVVHASRTQFPITPCYAVTVHKTQSLTLSSAIVHCAPEFSPFQTYVAISRVESEERLQVIGFQKRFILPAPPELSNFIFTETGNCDDAFGCCKCVSLDEKWFTCDDSTTEIVSKGDEDDDDNGDGDGDDDDDDNDDTGSGGQDKDKDDCNDSNVSCTSPSQYFESDSEPVVRLENILLCMINFSEKLSQPPPTFLVKDLLEAIINDVNEDGYSQSTRCAAQYGIAHIDVFKLLACIFWCRISCFYQKHLTELEVGGCGDMSIKDFTCATSKLHQLFLSEEYKNDLVSAFNLAKWSEIDDGQRGLGVMFVFHLYQMFAAEVRKIVERRQDEPVNFCVADMGPDGRGKIRYIGGWVIKKLIDAARQYVMENKTSQSSSVRHRINGEMKKITLLENNVVISHAAAEASNRFPGTLDQVESRQYRERGLLHITDEAFLFIMAVEQERVDKINLAKLSSLRDIMVQKSITQTISNTTLQAMFMGLFQIDSDGTKEIILKMYEDLVKKYFKMGAGQFLRDFRRDFHIQKSIAHRKAVMLRKQHDDEKKMKVTLRDIEKDRSPGKAFSHQRLRNLLEVVDITGIKRLYKRAELQRLCDAYNVPHNSRWNKGRLTAELANSIRQESEMPTHHVLSVYTVEQVQRNSYNGQNVVPLLRLRRV